MIEQIDRVFEQFGSAAVFVAKRAMLEKGIALTSLDEAFWRAARSVRSKLEEQIQRRRAELPVGLGRDDAVVGEVYLALSSISSCATEVLTHKRRVLRCRSRL
ncbi:hypothetical protein ERJ75_000070700 [Trypanosoma vivax]|nr:hypothetical protein ERJ75_000070700 [Trypanosoma vivax]